MSALSFYLLILPSAFLRLPPLLELFPLQPHRIHRLSQRMRTVRDEAAHHQLIDVGADQLGASA